MSATPLASAAPVTREWSLAEVNERFRAGARTERHGALLRRVSPLVVFTALLGYLAYVVLPGPSLLLRYWIFGLIAFDAFLAFAFYLYFRLLSENLRRPLPDTLAVGGGRLRLAFEGPTRRSVEVPLEAGSVFVSPPGLNPPVRLGPDGFRPRAFVRVETAGSAPEAWEFPVTEEAARAVHGLLAERCDFRLGYSEARNPLTRVWLCYDPAQGPGAAKGTLAQVAPKDLWSPAPTGYVLLSRKGRTLNPEPR